MTLTLIQGDAKAKSKTMPTPERCQIMKIQYQKVNMILFEKTKKKSTATTNTLLKQGFETDELLEMLMAMRMQIARNKCALQCVCVCACACVLKTAIP